MYNADTFDPANAIAIIGMAGRFPGAPHLEVFWQNLQHGVESVTFFSEQVRELAGVEPLIPQSQHVVNARAVLESVDLFDPSFFNLSPREAEIMDPQHRLFLECAWEVLENAGYHADNYEGAIGLYAGVGTSDYWFNLHANPALDTLLGARHIRLSNKSDFLCTRVSYKLNLRGPSFTVQTACSTSLVAVHLACQSLLNHECDMALAGGVRISVPQETGYVYEEGGIWSPDGHVALSMRRLRERSVVTGSVSS